MFKSLFYCTEMISLTLSVAKGGVPIGPRVIYILSHAIKFMFQDWNIILVRIGSILKMHGPCFLSYYFVEPM